MSDVFRQQYTRPIPEGAERTRTKIKRKGKEVEVDAVRFKGTDGKWVVAPVVEKGKQQGTHCRVHSPTWYGWVKGVAVPLCTNKQAARVMLADKIREEERVQAGMVDPHNKHHKRPLTEHVADYCRSLEEINNVARYVRDVRSRLTALLDGCGFRFIPDISASRVQTWLADLRKGKARKVPPEEVEDFTPAEASKLLGIAPRTLRANIQRHRLTVLVGRGRRKLPRATVEVLQDLVCQGCSIETSNRYLYHLKGFCNWLGKNKRTATNPVLYLEACSVAVDRRHDRRELTADELRRLLIAARESTVSFRGLDGEARFQLWNRNGRRLSSLHEATSREG
jgi:hypothetical protein